MPVEYSAHAGKTCNDMLVADLTPTAAVHGRNVSAIPALAITGDGKYVNASDGASCAMCVPFCSTVFERGVHVT